MPFLDANLEDRVSQDETPLCYKWMLGDRDQETWSDQ